MKKVKGIILSIALLGATASLLTGCGDSEKVIDFSLDTTNVDTQLEYNETLDLTNIVLKAKYEDGREIIIENDDSELYVDMGGFNKTISGKYTISYIYKGLKECFDVTVDKAEIVNFRIDRSEIPTHIEYGNEVDWSKLKAYAIRENGSETLLDPSEYVIKNSHFNKMSRGVYTFQVLYDEYYEDYFSVTVVADITDLKVDTTSFNSTIEWGKTLDLRNVYIYLEYEDGSEGYLEPAEVLRDVTYDYGDFDNRVAGEYTITAQYKDRADLTKTFTVTVAEPKSIGFEIDRSDVPEVVEYDTSVDFTKVKVYELFEDGSKVLLTSGYEIDSSNFNKRVSGVYEIKVLYNSYPYINLNVRVTAEVARLFNDIEELVTEYDWGQDYDLDGLVVIAELQDGKRFEISYADPLITIDNGGYDKNKAGVYVFTLTYNNDTNIQTKFSVNVKSPKEVNFETDRSQIPQVIEYGSDWDSTKLRVYSLKEDGSKSLIQPADYIVTSSGFDKNVEGVYTIYVKYKLYTQQSFNIEVKKLVTELQALNELNVAWGEEVDLSDLFVKVIRTESDYDTLLGTSDRLVIDLEELITNVAGKHNVTISYKNDPSITTTFVLNVAEPLADGIEVDASSVNSQPVLVGSNVDFTSLVVKLTYQDGSFEPLDVSEYELDLTSFTTEAAGTYTITVKYLANEDFTASFDIVVAEEQVDE